jgi:hypothetical protein
VVKDTTGVPNLGGNFMSSQPLDYAAILADLEAKRAAIDATIVAMRAAMGIGAVNITDIAGVVSSAPAGATQIVPAITGADIPDGAFFRKSVPEATAHLLTMLKKKQTTQEVADALLRGGMESNSDDFLSVVVAGLNRARKTPNSPIVKLPGNYWGLKEWYPKGIISANLSEHTKKRRKKKSRKASKTTQSVVANTAGDSHPTRKIGTMTKIMDTFKTSASGFFSTQELADRFSMNPNGMAGLLARLVNQGDLEKAPNGYRLPAQSTGTVQ